jgi:3',5'-cyclic-nucleotide phosphodiesterase
MKIRLLPSSFTHPGTFQSLTSFLINDHVLIDAGSAGFALGLEEISRIQHIFISHAHMDHIASLPSLLDNFLGMGVKPPEIWANAHTMKMLRQMIFNNHVWPDFLGITQEDGQPLVSLHLIHDNERLQINNATITPVPVNHVIPTHGFIIESSNATILISSDTGPTEAIWALANKNTRLDAVLLEVSFTNSMQSLASRACHLTPELFRRELGKINGHRPKVLAVHLKPWLRQQIACELDALNLENMEIMQPGKVYDI